MRCLLLLLLLAQSSDWKRRLGEDPIYAATLDRYRKSAERTVAQLSDPAQPPARDNWQPAADTCSALVNVYRLSGDRAALGQARQIADWLVRSDDYLVAHRDPQLPYLGWGPETRTGYFACADVSHYHADDLWDTAAATRCLLKVAEVEREPAHSPYYARARKIIDAWPYVDRQLANDGPYAAAGLRWYRKSTEPCENRYVKNTNVAMGEQLFRIWRISGAAADFERAAKVLRTQFWDVLTHHNLAYTSYMTYVDKAAEYAAQVSHNERKVVHRQDSIHCGAKDASCWNHLGYEGYAMFQIQQLTRDVPGLQPAIAKTVRAIMQEYQASAFGDTARFDWSSAGSVTHITAYHCAMRFEADPLYARECVAALAHKNSSATIFYSLVPESLFAAR